VRLKLDVANRVAFVPATTTGIAALAINVN
jgi:hypothetical protein